MESDGTRPVIVVRTDIPNADDPRARRLSVAANQIAHVDYDPDGDLLMQWAEEDKQLREMFDDLEWNEFVDGNAETRDAEPQIDRAEELREKWGVETGQLWQIGEHRLICGDCTDAAVVARVMGGEKAQAVVTDPPYGQNQKGVTNDEPEKLYQILLGCIKNLPVDNAVIVSFASPRTFTEWLDLTRASGHKFERMLWLYKAAQETFPWRGWLLKSEAILITSKGAGVWQDVHPYSHDCYYKSEVSGQLVPSVGWHGSVKPLDVVMDLIKRICDSTAIVYDPFCGSGTTMVACQNLGRKCRAVEISPAYCAVILERMATAFPDLSIARLE